MAIKSMEVDKYKIPINILNTRTYQFSRHKTAMKITIRAKCVRAGRIVWDKKNCRQLFMHRSPAILAV